MGAYIHSTGSLFAVQSSRLRVSNAPVFGCPISPPLLSNPNRRIHFEKEELHSCSSEGELLLTLMAAFAESESVSMSDNIKWGKRKRFENGTIECLALNNIYGFRKTGGGIAINETEAAVVRHIYDLFISGYGYTEIANLLIAEKAPTRREGATWANTTVKNIIANEKLCGDCLLHKGTVAMIQIATVLFNFSL